MKTKKNKRSSQNFTSIIIILLGIFLCLLFVVFENTRQRNYGLNGSVNKQKNENIYVLKSELFGGNLDLNGSVKGGQEVDLVAGADGWLKKLNVEEGREVYKGSYLMRITADLEGRTNQRSNNNPIDLLTQISDSRIILKNNWILLRKDRKC